MRPYTDASCQWQIPADRRLRQADNVKESRRLSLSDVTGLQRLGQWERGLLFVNSTPFRTHSVIAFTAPASQLGSQIAQVPMSKLFPKTRSERRPRLRRRLTTAAPTSKVSTSAYVFWQLHLLET